jgi:tetratricopeptide (TPR) repeat protein
MSEVATLATYGAARPAPCAPGPPARCGSGKGPRSNLHRKTVALALGVSSLSLLSKALDTPGDGALSSAAGSDASAVAKLSPDEFIATVALAGIRPLAVNALWVRSMDAFQRKDWTEALALYRAIAFLQPRCEAAWLLNGWNLAYNLAADRIHRGRIEDAAASVIEGIDFLRAGIRRNPESAELWSYLAWVLYDRGRDPDVARSLRARGEEPLDSAITAARTAAGLERGGTAAYWLTFYLSERASLSEDRAAALPDLDAALLALDGVTEGLAERAAERRAMLEARRKSLAHVEDRP